MQFILLSFCAGIIFQARSSTSTLLTCGPSHQLYHLSTHECVKGTVKKIESFGCGSPPEIINLRTHKCDNGVPMKIPEVPTRTPGITTLAPTLPPISRSAPPPWKRHPVCTIYQIPKGSACCHAKIYQPDNETCCIITRSHYQVLNGTENEHICCTDPETMTSKLYKRGSPDIPCQHASTNNKLLGKGKSLRILDMNRCESFTNIFKVQVMKQTVLPNNSRINLRIRGWETMKNTSRRSWKLSSLKTGYSDHVQAELDKYIPEQKKYVQRKVLNLKKKTFLLITDKNYALDAVFFLKPDEVLFRWPKNKSRRKVMKKIKAKCKY